MALISNTLVNGIRAINDQEYSGFAEFPESVAEAADRWATAINNYASLVTPPSATATLAKEALKAQLLLVDTLGVDAFVNGLSAYASALAGGMAPAFTGTPPPVSIVLAPIFASGFAGASSETQANAIASAIDLWFKTGTAINTTSGVTVTWL
jgi:hypothetical protein